MSETVVRTAVSLVVAAALAAPALAQDGGASIVERGTPDMGLSGAGNSARADDAATAHFNAAGMTRLETNEAISGLFVGIGQQDLSLSRGTASFPPGNFDGGGDIGDSFVGGGLYVVVVPDPDWRLGFTLNGLYGGSVDYDDEWAGRTFVTEASIIGMNLEPAVAYKVDEKLSLGASFNAVKAILDVKFKAVGAANSPEVHIDEADDWGFGFTLSALYEFDEDTRVGARYRSKVDLNLGGGFKNPTGEVLNFDSDMEFPASFAVGSRHQLSEDWAILADTSWTDWSVFSQAPTTIGPQGSIPIDREWDDTWRIGVGAEHQFDEDLVLRFGMSYDSDPVDDDKRLPDIPTSEFWRFSAGAEYALNETSKLGLTYTYAYLGHPDIDNLALPPTRRTVIDGTYTDSSIHFIGLTYTFQF